MWTCVAGKVIERMGTLRPATKCIHSFGHLSLSRYGEGFLHRLFPCVLLKGACYFYTRGSVDVFWRIIMEEPCSPFHSQFSVIWLICYIDHAATSDLWKLNLKICPRKCEQIIPCFLRQFLCGALSQVHNRIKCY